ncbi:guanitoxin biosynthesis heme-dependent pre-guanitoxin N-hydroxylase GntA [Streptomyces rubiginosohelvolus]|uniref:guanitoxin biosynthesis heme-dependent pre-guanitoxin N-hydroxylase GntA n=1 Tax=Streptomyces rubiginosohelvolus TaxID=67362 RepID=UPI00367B57A7
MRGPPRSRLTAFRSPSRFLFPWTVPSARRHDQRSVSSLDENRVSDHRFPRQGLQSYAASHQDPLIEDLCRWLISDSFSCLGARIAVRHDSLRVVALGEMGTQATTQNLHAEITEFTEALLREDENFATFVALFNTPLQLSELAFEERVWAQLQALHEVDRKQHPWASDVSSDPETADFGFSVAGHPFFVVGLHPEASRISRRFRVPGLAFNSHQQFRRLKASGLYGGLQQSIRAREIRLQGSINPALADFGEVSEARQYSGRPPTEEWICPFSAVVPEAKS